eukprot:TRINITY_DN28899_c0_g4_i1.p1 TRINITY_DN28899_c0_g4~~TRINITY_DN28899_c0_g4_i1.p1  ORF type:complete len:599 (-),score=126.85 TRINITY_DN28899_c0_g4_i1:38-1834(-)
MRCGHVRLLMLRILVLGGWLCRAVASPQQPTDGCDDLDGQSGIHWPSARAALWDVVEARSLREGFGQKLLAAQDSASSCPLGVATAALVLAAHSARQDGAAAASEAAAAAIDRASAVVLGPASFPETIAAGFPIFGALAWLLESTATSSDEAFGALGEACSDSASLELRAVLLHHLSTSTLPPPALPALDYLGGLTGSAPQQPLCSSGRASALLSLALSYGAEAEGEDQLREVWELVTQAEEILRATPSPAGASNGWPAWKLLHSLSLALSLPPASRPQALGGCLIMIYAYPTSEIRTDTEAALVAMEKYYLAHLGVQYPLVVFTDPATAPTLEEFAAFTSAPIVPAVIPQEALRRDVQSYSCVDGLDCVAGQAPASDAHRGVVNSTQFWSADYLRISRYTAGPLFEHPALDSCGTFLKIDTDFFFTAPVETDPIEEMAREGSRLGYWQIHVQGQRQAGYMDAAVEFLRIRNLPILNPAFYARGRFEERAQKLGIPLSEVPEALEASTLIYGCLFGGEVSFFREPLYQDFFAYMDAQRGFETRGWSNQFFLGTAAAAFLFPSQVRRLYLSGRHQDSRIDVGNGEVTEFLEGSTRSAFR